MKSTRRWQIVFLIVATLIFGVSLTLGGARLFTSDRELRSGAKENLFWLVAQLDYELQRLIQILHRSQIGDPELAEDEVGKRFDIFWSRVELLSKGEVAERLSIIDSHLHVVQSLQDALQELDPLLSAPGPLMPLDAAIALSILAPIETPVHRLTLDVNFAEQQRITSLREDFEGAAAIFGISLGGMLVGFMVLILLLRHEARRAVRISRIATTAQAAADEAKQRLATAIDNLSEGFVLFDAEDRLVISNAPFRQLYRLTEETCRPGRRFDELLRDVLATGIFADAVGREEEWLAKRLEQHRQPATRMEQHLSDGRWVLVQEKRIGSGGTVGIRVDVTPIRRAQQEAELTARMKAEFLAIMSHEVRTPLTGLIGMLDLLRGADLDPENREHLTFAIESAESMRRLVNEILMLSRLESRKVEVVTVAFQPRHLVESVALPVQVRAEQKGLIFRGEVDDDVPDQIQGDADHLRQLMVNLLDNAVKFTDSGRIDYRFSLLRGEAADRIRFAVADTGPGIDPQAQERIFEPFARGDSTYARRHAGSGLGLAICRRIAEALGGAVGVDSRAGGGSTFWVEVPVAAARRRSAPQIAPAVGGSGGRILVVDDSQVLRRLYSTYLRRAGFTVVEAADGEEAKSIAAREVFNLVLMDLSMPVVDGIAATRAIRLLPPPYGDPPIVALTANSTRTDEQRCIEAGMMATLLKPITEAKLLVMVQQVSRRLDPLPPPTLAAPTASPAIAGAGPDAQDGPPLEATRVAEMVRELGLESARELYEDFAKDTHARVQALMRWTGDLAQLKRWAHALKGGALSFGARAVGERAAALEAAAAAGELATAQALLLGLPDLAERNLRDLRASLDEAAGVA